MKQLITVFIMIKCQFRDLDDNNMVQDSIIGEENIPTELEKYDDGKLDSSLSKSDNERLF